MATLDQCSLESDEWSFMVDADHAGNAEIQNRRRSQNGLIIKLNRAPVMFESKASSIAFATPLIGEAHADISSAAVEIFSVGNATMTIMGLSYVVEEMGNGNDLPYPLHARSKWTTMLLGFSAQVLRTKSS